MSLCDVFVFLDDVQFKKNEWQNRNRIKTAQGEQYLTVPVHYKFPQKINEVGIDDATDWPKKHLASLGMNYSRAPFYREFITPVEQIIGQSWKNLAELNAALTLEIAGALDIRCKILTSSQMAVTGESTDRLISICKAVGADTYLSGSGGKGYLNEDTFRENSVKLVYQEFHHPVHAQVSFKSNKEFLPNLAIVDLLFNCGKESGKILKAGGRLT